MTILWPNGQASPPNFSAEGHFGLRQAMRMRSSSS